MVRAAHIELDPDAILFVDDDLIAVDKAPGVLCDASIDPNRDHLGKALIRWADDDNAVFLPAHRLDKGTSGVVLFARSRSAATALMHQFQERSVVKKYEAVVEIPSDEAWSIGKKIERRSYLRHRKGVSEEVRSGGKPAASSFEVLDIDNQIALVRALPQTGRTHQLRVHLAALGAAILGDDRYGPRPTGHSRLWLNAYALTISHPTTNEPVELRSRLRLQLHDGGPKARPADERSAD